MPRVIQKYHEDAKKRIIAAAIEVADEKGLDGVTLDAIAQNVGVSIPALYTYFENREALLSAVVLEVVRKTQVGLESVFSQNGNIRKTVEELASLLFEERKSYTNIFFQLPVLVRQNPKARDELSEIFHTIRVIIHDYLVRKKNEEMLSQKVDPDEATRIIFAITIGLNFSSLVMELQDINTIRKTWIDTVERSLLIGTEQG